MAVQRMSLYSVEIEAHSLALLLQHPDTWGEFHPNDRGDYSKAHQPLYDILSLQLNSTPPGSVAPIVLAEKLRGLGVTALEGGFAPLEYLEGLLTRYVEVKDAGHLARELKRLTVRRQLIEKMDGARKELVAKPGASFEEMTALVERNLTAVNTGYYRGEVTAKLFEGYKDINEKRAANPIDASKMGWMGPFELMNRTLGALLDKGLWVTIGARTGQQKSALGFHYHVAMAELHQLPVLILDCGEMTRERVRDRAACCLSKGRIPLWAIKSGEWAQNKAWADIMRGEVYPRVDKILPLIDFASVGGLSPREKRQLVLRHAYNRVGRGNPFCILDDYLKGSAALGHNTQEYQTVGYYVEDMKTIITNDIPASFWTSVQENRGGITRGKSAKDIVDSEENLGLSDRIIQQSDWGFGLRFKVAEEEASEKSLFGNMRLTPYKKRELVGKDSAKALQLVKLPNGRLAENYFHLMTAGFAFTEMGDLRSSLEVLGNAQVDLGPDDPAKPKVKGL